MNSKAAHFFKRTWIWFGPTLTFLLCAELAARPYYHRASKIPIVPHEVLNHAFTPHSMMYQARFESQGLPAYTRKVNKDGFVGEREFSQSKPEGVYRIAYLGDSFIEGTCPEDASVPTIVGKRLKVPGRSSVEVINAGVSSYSPTIYYLLLKTRLLAFEPDLVVVNIDMTDVYDDFIYKATIKTDSDGDITACLPRHPALATHRRTERGLERITFTDSLVGWLYEKSSFIRMVMDAASNYRHRILVKDGLEQERSTFAWCNKERSPETQRDVDWSMSILRRLILFAKERGIGIVVTAVPHRQQLEGSWSLQPMDDISKLCREEEVPFLNPVAAFKRRLGDITPSAIYIPGDIHFTPEGYRMWADIQLDFLESLLRQQPAKTNLSSKLLDERYQKIGQPFIPGG